MRFNSSPCGARGNALWGRGGRTRGRLGGFAAVLALVTALAVPAAGIAGPGPSPIQGGPAATQAAPALPGVTTPGVTTPSSTTHGAFVPASLLAQALANPNQTFQVIVQGTRGQRSSAVASDVTSESGRAKHIFSSISGASVAITGKRLVRLASHSGILSITLDQTVKTSDYQDGQMWSQSTDIQPLWNTTDPDTGAILGPAPQAPAVAVVDSGIDTSRAADFGTNVIASVNLCSLCTDGTTNDLEGHGTMVAGLLAGQSAEYMGAAPNAPLVNVRTADAQGESLTSDVLAAADWILAHKDQYNIKVANFSMAGGTPTTFRYDPLDQAVEKLWFAGITVVAAAGNFGTGNGPVDMSMAPGNDPFVITVGAVDQQQTSDPSDDTVPYWSAYGYSADGFSKPDLVAPGRYMVMPVPMGTTIPNTVPDRVVSPGYMWMSGTSFAAPIVSGAAAQILARHPDWGPDQVKGALMLTAAYLPNTDWQQAGVGEVDAASAASLPFTPPNPNENLYQFVSTDPTTGQTTFDQAAWASAVSGQAAWASAAWASAAWASAAWASAAWASAAWSSSTFSANAASLMSGLVTYSEATYAP
jgi:serine protease AprX